MPMKWLLQVLEFDQLVQQIFIKYYVPGTCIRCLGDITKESSQKLFASRNSHSHGGREGKNSFHWKSEKFEKNL